MTTSSEYMNPLTDSLLWQKVQNEYDSSEESDLETNLELQFQFFNSTWSRGFCLFLTNNQFALSC